MGLKGAMQSPRSEGFRGVQRGSEGLRRVESFGIDMLMRITHILPSESMQLCCLAFWTFYKSLPWKLQLVLELELGSSQA